MNNSAPECGKCIYNNTRNVNNCGEINQNKITITIKYIHTIKISQCLIGGRKIYMDLYFNFPFGYFVHLYHGNSSASWPPGGHSVQ